MMLRTFSAFRSSTSVVSPLSSFVFSSSSSSVRFSHHWTTYKLNDTAGGFSTSIFPKESIRLSDRKEFIIRGSRALFSKLPEAFDGIRQIGIIGWGSQGPAQAMNLRDSLVGTNICVKVGLREGSSSIASAEQKGFTFASNTLGEMFDVIRESDLNILLISDTAMAEQHEAIFRCLRPGSSLGLSHGFLLGHLKNIGKSFPENINVLAVCPKGMGPSVRRLYEQGKEVNGAGINCSFAVHQDVTGKATEIALGWAIGIGSPTTFQCTLESEYKSDIFGERGILLGAVHGVCEVLYRFFVSQGMRKDEAYLRAVEGITGPISSLISHEGLKAVYEKVQDKILFARAYCAAYNPSMDVLVECYEDVASGREIGSVNDHARRFTHFPMKKIDSTELWKVAADVRKKRTQNRGGGGGGGGGGGLSSASSFSSHAADIPVDAITAGIYLATMVAQCDLLISAGHLYNEVVNESIIEAVDSLNPYMHFRGVAYMVDNCSTTARIGARKWAPRFDYLLEQQAIPKINKWRSETEKGRKLTMEEEELMEKFHNHKIHEVIKVCLALRPSVDIVPHITELGEVRSSSVYQ